MFNQNSKTRLTRAGAIIVPAVTVVGGRGSGSVGHGQHGHAGVVRRRPAVRCAGVRRLSVHAGSVEGGRVLAHRHAALLHRFAGLVHCKATTKRIVYNAEGRLLIALPRLYANYVAN